MRRFLSGLFARARGSTQPQLTSWWIGATPSFWTGVGSAVDLGGTLLVDYNTSNTPDQADARALYSDWRLVGVDLDNALLGYARQSHEASAPCRATAIAGRR